MKRIFCCLAVVAWYAVQALGQKPDLFILSVGVEQYRDSRLNLNYCVDDARDLAAAISSQTRLYNVVDVKVLTDAQATRSGVRRELEAFERRITSDDLFVFIFSGHGIEERLVPWDFDLNDQEASSLSKSDLFDKINRLGCGYLLLIDACHSGSFAKSLPGIKDIEDSDAERYNRSLVDALAGADKPCLVFGSSGSDQKSWECNPCGHGYFAQTILDALKNKTVKDGNRRFTPDADGDGVITPYELDNYIKEAVRVNTAGEAMPQKVYSRLMMGRSFPLFRTTGGSAPAPNPNPNPDSDPDHDGFVGADDECPDEYGTLRGCPDTDGDGVADRNDVCPFEAGTVANRGCPVSDRDGDGVVDDVDKCPDAPGKKEWQGCPDSDGDGIPDHKDKCPSERGVAARDGCPNPVRPLPSDNKLTDALAGTFVLVKGGTFTMGCQDGRDVNCDDDENPAHVVRLNDFYLGETELTQAQWRAVMGNNPSYNAGCDECPVERVSWDDVQEFLSKLNSRVGGGRYRLPTEAEWEYAARGGNLSRGYLYAGSNDVAAVAWYDGNSGDKTHPVKGKAANELGLYDMTGNVWEWCSDWYGAYSSGSQENPAGPSSGSYRVRRGGSWNDIPQYCRVSFRLDDTPVSRSSRIGFRLARTVNF